MTWSHDAWVKAWGANLPMIVGGINDEGLTNKLPVLPPGYDFIVTRDVTHGRNDEVFPTYRVTLMQRIVTEDDETYDMKVLTRGKIDKTFYGEAGVVELARSMKEKYCARRLEPGSAAGIPAGETGTGGEAEARGAGEAATR